MDKYIKPEHVERVVQEIILFLPRVPIALFFLIAGWLVINFIIRGFRFALTKKNLDPALKNFLLSIASIFFKIILLISVASTVGIATTSFITILGAAGLAIGMALQGSLSNFAGSVLLMVFKPFRTGDIIIAQNQEGTVKDISVFNTILTTADNQRVIIPNGALANGVIVNMSAEKTRRITIKVGIGYEDNTEKARQALLKLCAADERVLNLPFPPEVILRNFGASSLDLELRVWVKTEDYWPVFFSLMEKIKISFEQEEINIPFPQTDIRIHNVNPKA